MRVFCSFCCAEQLLVDPADIPKNYLLYHIFQKNKNVWKKERLCHLTWTDTYDDTYMR